MHVSQLGYRSSAPYAADQSTPTISDNRQNFAGVDPYAGPGLQTPGLGRSSPSPELQALPSSSLGTPNQSPAMQVSGHAAQAGSSSQSLAHPQAPDQNWGKTANMIAGQDQGAKGQRPDLAKKALVDRAYSEQKREQRAPGVDVAVIADFEKKTRGVPYKLTIPLYGHSGMGAYLANRRLTEFHEASSHRFYRTEEWSRVVNDC